MRLLRYKVNKFRSVKGTEWIDIDKLACLVGLNESGKTNLLLPLWKFNPADDATKIDMFYDYPRDEYPEIKGDDDSRTGEPFIETLFELTDEQTNFLQTTYEHYINSPKPEETDEEEGAEAEKKEDEDVEGIVEEQARGDAEKLLTFTKYLLIKKDYNESFYIHISNEECEEISKNIKENVGKGTFVAICNAIPRFIYYSEYGNLDSKIYLPDVKNDLGKINELNGKRLMKARTLKILFNHLGLDYNEIEELGVEHSPGNDPEQIANDSQRKQKRYAKLNSAAKKLTKQFKDWWTQGDYVFQFTADGNHFGILVSDAERKSPIELESRSKGLQWFFSFFLVFLAESEDQHKNCILLLDEPGLHLHPNAQTDLSKFFNQLSEKNQLIYTTHLPFLVDHNNLDRVKAVYSEDGLTKVSNDLSKADKEGKAIQPVNAAIGITVSQSLLIGCDIIIVEGVSDQFYLNMMKNYLVSKGKIKPKREMVFIPVKGVRGIKPVVSIIHVNMDSLPYVLLDSDEAGKSAQASLRKDFYCNEGKKVLETDSYTEKKGSEIEDLIPVNLIVDSFDRIFRPDEPISATKFASKKPIMPQLKQIAEDKQIPLELGWKVEISKKVKEHLPDDIPDDLPEKWIALFKDLQDET